MEFPDLGDNCQEPTCNTLDFLPFRCDSCQRVFCKNHYKYDKHSCSMLNAKNKDFQVPICPLCNQAVPFKRNELPDIMMSAHIDRDCKSDPAEERRRKIFNNKCNKKGCKKKELLPFVCTRCRKNYCIRHRNEIDHECNEIPNTGENKEINSKRLFNIFQRQQQQQEQTRAPQTNQRASQTQQRTPQPQRSSQPRAGVQARQPNSMTDKEALDYALRLSLQESTGASSTNNRNQNTASNVTETEEETLARILAESEREYRIQQEKKDSACNIG